MAFCSKCGVPVEGEYCTQCGAPAVSGGSTRSQAEPSSPIIIPSPAEGSTVTRKKRGPLFWVLLGCGGLILVAAVIILAASLFFMGVARRAGVDTELMKTNPALAAAKMLAATNPDVEVVSIDEGKGIIRLRDKKTGKTMTMNLEDLQKGKIIFEDDQGGKIEMQAKAEGENASLDVKGPEGTLHMGSGGTESLPDWLPAYPGWENTGTLEMTDPDKRAGSLAFKTSDAAEDVAAFFENALKKAGFAVERTTNQVPSQSSLIILEAKDSSEQRRARILVSGGREGTLGATGTTVTLIFADGK